MNTLIGILVSFGFLFPLSILLDANNKLSNENSKLRHKCACLERQNSDYRWELIKKTSTIQDYSKYVPQGTIQAVREMMKRSHPDNGGNAKDFQMYRKAYNILIGRESK
jgi:hypothetical protein